MIELLFVVVALIVGIYMFLTWNFEYWKELGIPYEKPVVLFGGLRDVFLTEIDLGDHFKKLYKKYDGNSFNGFYLLRKPALMIRDPELVKSVLVKDFDHFVDRFSQVTESSDRLGSKTLFSTSGNRWKSIRIKISPALTSGKMKMLFELMAECGQELGDIVRSHAQKGDIVEIKDLTARYTTDNISSCIFGIQCHSLKNPKAEFREVGRRMVEPSLRSLVVQVGLFIFPEISRLLKLTFVEKSVQNFFRSVIKDNIKHRKSNNIYRPDLLQLLIDLKDKGSIADDDGDEDEDKNKENANSMLKMPSSYDNLKIDDEDIFAHAMTFFFAGFETSASTMCFSLYELSLNPEVQVRLRKEITSVLEAKGGKISYDAIQEMKYLDLVISETLRKYPALGFLDRKCTKDYTIPGSKVVIPKEFPVYIPVKGIHHDPKYYPEPEKFIPERFLEENKRKRPNYTYMPFGDGPRMCIGNRFALMQTKIGLASILTQCEVHVCKDTMIPMVLDKRNFLSTPKGGLFLRLKPLTV